MLQWHQLRLRRRADWSLVHLLHVSIALLQVARVLARIQALLLVFRQAAVRQLRDGGRLNDPASMLLGVLQLLQVELDALGCSSCGHVRTKLLLL